MKVIIELMEQPKNPFSDTDGEIFLNHNGKEHVFLNTLQLKEWFDLQIEEENAKKARLVTFLYRNANNEVKRRMLRVTNEDVKSIRGMDADIDDFRTFLKNNVVGEIHTIKSSK